MLNEADEKFDVLYIKMIFDSNKKIKYLFDRSKLPPIY